MLSADSASEELCPRPHLTMLGRRRLAVTASDTGMHLDLDIARYAGRRERSPDSLRALVRRLTIVKRRGH